jgi:uncharacterized protein YcfJ
MNKSMIMGALIGIGVATAGGVAGYALFGDDQELSSQSATGATEERAEEAFASASAPTVSTVAPSTAVGASTSAQAVQEECWDEEVTVQSAPRDEHKIAGTTAGALIGGALAKELGDDNDRASLCAGGNALEQTVNQSVH